MNKPGKSTEKIIQFYKEFDEKKRLEQTIGKIEFHRTKELILRYLKKPPALVLDVGGAVGRYSCWLANKGYEVHLIDPVPWHIKQARLASEAQAQAPITSIKIGDARKLEFKDETADAVLMLGPLYHLCEFEKRYKALKEAHRVLKKGGYLFAVGISKFASTIDGLSSGFFLDPEFRSIMRRDLKNGRHKNPTTNSLYFMDTFFHHPDELKAEVKNAEFELAGLFAIEGISYLMKDFDKNWEIKSNRDFLLKIITSIETEPTLLGASPHIMCVAHKP